MNVKKVVSLIRIYDDVNDNVIEVRNFIVDDETVSVLYLNGFPQSATIHSDFVRLFTSIFVMNFFAEVGTDICLLDYEHLPQVGFIPTDKFLRSVK